MKSSLGEFIVIAFLVLCAVSVGWFGNEVYDVWTHKRNFDGLYLQSAQNYNGAINTAHSYDKNGDWVCVNINGMDFKRAIEVCQHEVGHEIFAEIIEDHPEKINEVMEVLEDE